LAHKSKSGSTTRILEGELEHLAARLEAINDKACKGVHDYVTAAEARLTVIQCYLFIAEVARANEITPAAPIVEKAQA